MAVERMIGPYSAYALAVKHGYVGSEEEWARDQINAAEHGRQAKESAEAAKASEEQARESAEAAKASEERAEQAAQTARETLTATQEAKESAVSAVTVQESKSIRAVESAAGEATTSAQEAIGRTKTEAVSSVETAKQNGVAAVESQQAASVKAVQDAGNAKVSEINQAGDVKISAINQAGETQVSSVNQAGDTALAHIESDRKAALEDIKNEVSKEIDAAKLAVIDKVCPPLEQSGPVVQCYPVEGYPLDVVTRIEAVQEGEGDPSPDNVRPIVGWDSLTVTRCGKNLLKINEFKSYTTGGLTFEYVEGGGIHIYGTSTDRRETLTYAIKGLPPGIYIGNTYPGLSPILVVKRKGAATNTWLTISKVAQTIYPGDEAQYYYLSIIAGTYDIIFYPQIELGSTASPYAPYTGDTYTQALPETIYGGSYNWATGELVVDYQLLNLAELTWTREANVYFVGRSPNIKKASNSPIGKCSHHPYLYKFAERAVFGSGILIYCGEALCRDYGKDVTAWVSYLDEQAQKGTPVQIAQKLAEPYAIHLTPQQILALPGVDTVFSNAGDTTVSARADPIHLTQSMLDRLAAVEAAQTGL